MAFNRESAGRLAELTAEADRLIREARDFALDHGLPLPQFNTPADDFDDWDESDWESSDC